MGGGSTELKGPDLKKGVRLDEVPEGGTLLGHADGEAVILSRRGDDVRAIGASCTHYGGPLAEGLVVGDAVHCPWHHACFDLRTGEAIGAPALNAVPCWNVVRAGDLITLGTKRDAPPRSAPASAPPSVAVIGAGAAGGVVAEQLRREGYAGAIVVLGDEPSAPVDRPNLSKDYLAGTAPEEWIPLRSADFYTAQRIDLRLSTRVEAIDVAAKTVRVAGGGAVAYGALVLATGAAPNRFAIPGSERVMYLRSLADSRAIIDAAKSAKRAVVLGASFIGLEVAASLRTRGIEVDVVAPETAPLARVLGDELGAFVRALHEEKGVRFHLGTTPRLVGARDVTLESGATLAADLVVAGIGVRPRTELAEKAGLKVDKGVVVNERLETSAPGVYAVGDIARYPDATLGEPIRVEHWVVAERQAQHVARVICGRATAYRDVPFFWSQHYDVPIAYVGHAAAWDRVRVKGSIEGKDCLVGYERGGKIVAVASIYRDTESLAAEAAFARGDFAAVAKLFA